MNCKKTVQRDIWSVLKFYACCYKFTKKKNLFLQRVLKGFYRAVKRLKTAVYIYIFLINNCSVIEINLFSPSYENLF